MDIICSECNNFFGRNIDIIGKDFFNKILHVLEFKNASGFKLEDTENNENFLIKKNGKISQIKPTKKTIQLKGKKLISITGEPKNTRKLFKKEIKRLKEKGSNLLISKLEEKENFTILRAKANFKTNSKINLLINKIATEYCAYNKIKTQNIEILANKVKNLSEDFENVFYSTQNKEYREIKDDEISHYIKLWSFNNKIYVFIELFNVLNTLVVVDNDYKGNRINFEYYQDAISGEKFSKYPKLDINHLISIFSSNECDLSSNVNKLIKRKKSRDLKKEIYSDLENIKNRLDKELEKGLIDESEFTNKYVNETTTLIANYQIENPYIWDDIDHANDDEINYYHSNLRENQFEEFCQVNSNLIGLKVKFDNNKTYIIKGFEKRPLIEQNGILIIKVYIVLFNAFNTIYIPYREFFENTTIE